MSLIYIAASWREVERARAACEALRGVGHDVWAFWEKPPRPLASEIEAFERTDADDPAATVRYLRLHRAKLDCLLAIRESDLVVLVEPAGNDAHYEAGFALAEDVSVLRFGRGRPGLMTFDAPVAEAGDLNDLVALAGILIGRAARPRELAPAPAAPAAESEVPA